MAGSFPKVGLEGRGINQLPTHHFHHVMLGGWGWAKATLWETGPQSRLKSCTGRLPMDQAFPLGGCPNSAGTLRSESETQRKPEVPASPRGEALFRCARPSGVLQQSTATTPYLGRGVQLFATP